ncbi:acyl-CoA thioester hydrolase [Pustulibacterium marinum]|uniref:Acyl-CoA thioester hydrolase n=1 Tax=Pustulibacterium marinum TaxID=1224947 RepID=A0A1I7GZ22_9FLAO|nr:thioesterase family protein [Pustulibacterium marinum]SFU53662.1 acyl-CoA thioester hydrolase [Pustulibacterium marinum]
MKFFESTLTVTKEHLDALNHVNNVVYVQWIQDIATKHWNAVAPKDFAEQYIWVVAAHHIYYKGESVLGDKLLLKTYIEDNHGVISNRKVEIYKNEKLILTANTEWCLLTIATKRPTRIPQEIKDLFVS